MSRGRLLVVVNPKASRAEQLLGPALGMLAMEGFELETRLPPDRVALAEVIRNEAKALDGVVIAGGDGTVNGALPALLDVGRPFGILPIGTANDLALTLGIPTDPTAAAATIVAGHTRRIDLGKVNEVHFLNVASIGLSVDIAQRQDPELKQQWGVLSYAVAAISTLGEAEKFHATIRCDNDREDVEAFQIAVGNGVHYGGGMKIAPDAAIDDGFLDVYALATRTVADLVVLAPTLLTGKQGARDDVIVMRGRKVSIETPSPMPVNTDGEVTTETPAVFSVIREALEVFAAKP